MAIANNKDLTHVVRTTQQWQSSYDKYECIPEGVLCIEFTTSGQALAKIGNGRDIFSKLPYIGGADLTNYYTKSETAKCVEEIIKANRFIRIKGILQNKDQLPSHADCGDLYFVISQNQSSSNKYDEYVYSPSNTWENLGSIPIDIDLSEYAKIVYVDEKIDEVNERIDDIEQHGTHTHANKDILDLITAAFTAEEKDKLSTLYNYDDTELRELITQASHTHSNKDILDAISAPFTKEDKSKLDQLNPYDDSILKEKITALERLAHEHSNKRILDRTTASFTTEYERKMRWIRLYTGCTGMEEGIAGLVPAAQAGEEDYVLSGSGEWVPQTGGGGTYELPIATTSTLGGIKVGNGLEIDANGKLSVVGGGGGGDSIAEGNGITITTDPQTGVKTISVNTGDHLEVDENTGELNVTDVDYEAGHGIHIGSNYNFLEYIKNSGNYDQIILTDILPKFSDTLEVDVMFGAASGLDSNREFIGTCNYDGASTVGDPFFYGIYVFNDNIRTSNITFYNHFVWTPQCTNTNFIDNPYGIDYYGNNPVRQIARMQGSTGSWGNVSRDFSDQYRSDFVDPFYPMAIFGSNHNNNVLYQYICGEITLYGVKLYDSLGTLIHDLRPVERVSDNAAGLYDVLTNKFYGNAGGGSFVKGPIITTPDRIINAKIGNGLQFDSNNAIKVVTGNGLQINQDGEVEIDPSIIPEVSQYYPGEAIDITASSDSNLPAGYAEVDYIEAPGNAYTIIDYIPNRNTKIIGTAMMTDTSPDAVVFGARTSSNGQQFVFWFNRYSSTQAKVGFVYGTNTWSTSTDANDGKLIPYVVGDQFTFLLSLEDEFNVNGEFVHDITENGAPASDIKLGIFALTTSNTGIESNDTIFKGRMYEFKIYENDELVVNLVPAIYISTNSVGFYDTIGDTFYTSRTSTPFICDPSTVHVSGYLVNVKYNQGLTVNQDNELEVNTGDGLTVNQNNELEVNLGAGLQFDNNNAIEINTGTGVNINDNNELNIELNDVLEAGNGINLTAQSSILPRGYGQLSYIEGNGNQWTQLDYVPVHDSRVVVDCISYETTRTDRALFGCREGTGGRPQFVLWCGNKTSDKVTMSFIYGSNTWSDDYNTSIPLGTRFTADASYNGLYINGELFRSITDQGNMPAYKVALFTVANGDGTYITDKGMGKYRIYSFKIYEGNSLVVDLVPAISALGVGLYDVVNDKFYRSLTSTAFLYDASSVVYPSAYQISAKIGSGLSFNQNGEIEADQYTLPTASTNTLGGVKVGTGLSIAADGTLSATGGGSSGGGPEYAEGDAIEINTQPLSFNVDAIRWDISDIKSVYQQGGPYTQMRSVEFCDSSNVAHTLDSGSAIWSDGDTVSYASVSETIDELVANTGKMCAIWRYPNHVLKLTFNLDTVTPLSDIVKFRMKTANDTSERDPKAWKIYVRNVTTQQWYLVHEISDAEITGSRDTWSNYYTFTPVTETSINVKYGTGLSVDPITNELFVNGQLPEGTIIKKMTYVGDGSTSSKTIQFEKKPLAILNIYGCSGTNYIASIGAPIDAPYLQGNYGGVSTNGNSCSCAMSYNDSTNELTFTPSSGGGSDSGLLYNVNGITYTMFYLTKGHAGSGTSETNEVSVIRSFTYIGDGTNPNNIQFPETPDMLVTISAPGGDNTRLSAAPSAMDADKLVIDVSDANNNNGVIGCSMSFNSSTNVLTLSTTKDISWCLNMSGTTYTVFYAVNETLSASLLNPGEGIDIDSENEISVKYNKGLTVNQDNELEVNVGDGLQINQDGELEIDPTIIPEVIEYEAGTAISIENVEHGGVTFDAWDGGTGWENVCYGSSTGNSVVSYQYEAHSPISNSYTLPAGATHIRAIAYDQNDAMLWTSFSWIDSNAYHFASTSPEEGHYSDWFDIPTGAVKVNFGVRHSKLNTTTAMSLNDIKSVDITIQTVNEIEVDVWNGGSGWLNGNYYSGNSDTFTTSWYYSYHSNPDAYIPIPNGATHLMVMGISNENDSHFEGGGVNVFSAESHSNHIYWWSCAWKWHEISSDAKFVQIDVKWSNNNTRTISGSDIKSVTLVWKLPALEINQAINVKYGDGLTVNQNNELEVNLGSGLQFDSNGAIEVTGGGGGDTIAEGNGISITDDQQTGDKIISVNYGDGLTIDPVTGVLMFDGQLPEGTIIKKLTYTGDGGATNNIQFEKKPIAILSIYGAGQGTKVSSCAAPIDAPILNVSYGTGNGGNTAGIVSCTMSYNDTTNVLSLTGGNDPGVRCNMSGETYTVYYLTKGHAGSGTSVNNEVSVIKTITYTGTGTATNSIQFPETPDFILSINGKDGVSGDMVVFSFDNLHPSDAHQYIYTFCYNAGISSNYFAGGHGTFDFNPTTNVLTLTGADQGAACNYLDRVYYLRYVVNEVISNNEVYDYIAGEGISIKDYSDILPDGYTAVKALKSTGNQYINTGYIIKANASFEMQCTIYETNHGWVFPLGTRNSSNAMMFCTEHWSSGSSIEYWLQDGDATATAAERSVFYNEPVVITINDNVLTCVNQTTHGTVTLTATGKTMPSDIPYPLYVFATNDTGGVAFYGDMDLYSFKILESGTVVHEYIPCLDSNNVAGLYDIYTDTFKTSPNGNPFFYISGTPVGEEAIKKVQLKKATTSTLGGVIVGDGLSVDSNGELEVNLGTGLAFDPQTGAINVTGGGGGSGDTVAEGAGIEITTDQQTGNKVVAVNAGTGLQVDQTTNELEIDDSVVTEDDELNLVFVPDDYQPS